MIQAFTASLKGEQDDRDTAKDEYKKQRKQITRLTRALRKEVRKAEGIKEAGDYQTGSVSISRENLDFLVDLGEKPPEGMSYRGAFNYTLVDLEDFAREVRDKEVEIKSDEKGANAL